MTLSERIRIMKQVFADLSSTNSIVDKRYIVSKIEPDCKEDFLYIVQCLNGTIKFGYNYYNNANILNKVDTIVDENWTIKQVLQFLRTPLMDKDLSHDNISKYLDQVNTYWYFFQPIVDREIKLGIGMSLFEKTTLSPMLAKKFEGTVRNDSLGYYITEKLDGNRCIAHYDNNENKWHFTSRNGKEMRVDFDMSGLPTDFIYDGEVLSPEQVELSNAIYHKSDVKTNTSFNSTSGIINSNATNKNLIYNIFDCIDLLDENKSYKLRREFLDRYSKKTSYNVRILPVLHHYCERSSLELDIYNILDYVTGKGGEGIMINYASAPYSHKSTDVLLKFKKVQTVDMKVIDVIPGTGKYEGLIGSLVCELTTDDGKHISCNVGSGLSDEQRYNWSLNTLQIIGKIVEIAYFSLSQDSNMIGTNEYSLRFPRLKQIRTDKNTTSEY